MHYSNKVKEYTLSWIKPCRLCTGWNSSYLSLLVCVIRFLQTCSIRYDYLRLGPTFNVTIRKTRLGLEPGSIIRETRELTTRPTHVSVNKECHNLCSYFSKIVWIKVYRVIWSNLFKIKNRSINLFRRTSLELIMR